MNTKQKSKSPFIVFAILLLTGSADASAVKGQGTVLSRVQTIDDPELGELVRVALENLPETKRLRQIRTGGKEYEEAKATEATARLRTVRLVTEAYMHIKLLDSQIEQSEAKLAASNLPDALTRELILAKAELEYQRATKLAELREIMNIIPRHALGRKPVKDLNGWLRLDVIGDSVLVFERPKPFSDDENRMRDLFVKLMPRNEATKYAVDYMLKNDHRPVRVDIGRNVDGVTLSEELEEELIRVVKREKLELEAEVHLSESFHGGYAGYRSEYYAMMDKLGRSILKRPRRISESGQPTKVVTELEIRYPLDLEEFDEDVRDRLVGRPERLPVKFSITYDEQTKDLASKAEGIIRDVARKHGVDKLVEVTRQQYVPDEDR